MIALLLNSGLGSRMGDETREHPKCMCRLTEQETIISWQVKLLRRSPDHFSGFTDFLTAKSSLTISIRVFPGILDELPSACRMTVLQSVWCARTISNEIVDMAPRLYGAPR